MKIYKVGGAVRDYLLGVPVKDVDWVVVGVQTNDLLSQGYQPVGSDFPVFIHPQTKEEYALARTEKKTGRGYGGFSFYTSPEVTLEEDLARRDLTINAIAEDEKGILYDPFNGLDDLKHKQLRHVSAAFVEDPLRVLRVARFAARYYRLGFTVAHETQVLMRQMVDGGELCDLTPERIWKELSRALMEANPEVFFAVLDQCGALSVLLPELVEQMAPLCSVLKKTADHFQPLEVRWGSLFIGLAKLGHQEAIKAVNQRLKVPNECKDIALLVGAYLTRCQISLMLTDEDILSILQKTDVVRRMWRLEALLAISSLEANEDKALSSSNIIDSYLPSKVLFEVACAVKTMNTSHLIDASMKGEEIAKAIRIARLSCIKNIMDTYR